MISAVSDSAVRACSSRPASTQRSPWMRWTSSATARLSAFRSPQRSTSSSSSWSSSDSADADTVCSALQTRTPSGRSSAACCAADPCQTPSIREARPDTAAASGTVVSTTSCPSRTCAAAPSASRPGCGTGRTGSRSRRAPRPGRWRRRRSRRRARARAAGRRSPARGPGRASRSRSGRRRARGAARGRSRARRAADDRHGGVHEAREVSGGGLPGDGAVQSGHAVRPAPACPRLVLSRPSTARSPRAATSPWPPSPRCASAGRRAACWSRRRNPTWSRPCVPRTPPASRCW